jgi:uncharacterized protein (DUF1501 family)
MKRRKFLRNSGAISLGSLLLNNLPVTAFASNPLSVKFTCEEMQGRIMVLINQQGANDTLNTVIPVEQYDTYASNRPSIKIPLASAIALDTTQPLNKQSYLHPSLAPLKTLYDAGKMNVVHGIGYLNGNRSHFKSDDLWNTAGDSLPANFSYESGWAGQLFDWRFPGLLGSTVPSSTMPDPPCIEFGIGNGSILFNTSNGTNASIFLTRDDASSYYTNLNGLGGQSPNAFPNSDYGNELKYIDDIKKLSNIYGLQLQNVFNAGTNSATTYPTSELANQLKTVAKLIKGGCKSNLYLLHQYGYDTHGQQSLAGSPTTGFHANLLKDLADAIKAFQDDITLLGFDDRVVTSTYSEFGRTLDENTGRGTDHGEVGTMFIVGNGVKPGVTGTAIDLSAPKVFNRGLIDLQYDYRSVWTAILQDFMAHGPQGITAARMQNFLGAKAPIIKASYTAPQSCYINNGSLSVNKINLFARLMYDGNAEVYWETENENECNNYEVEHSEDGYNWKKIGTIISKNITGSYLYKTSHTKPVVGINYYRLKQNDLNGAFKIVGPVNLKVKSTEGFTVSVYPNPAVFDFNIAITADKLQQTIVQFYDVQGHLLLAENITVKAGFNKFNFPVSKFKKMQNEILIHLTTALGVSKTVKLFVAAK